MPTEIDSLLRRLIGGNPEAPREVIAEATTSTSPVVLVAAAVVSADPGVLEHARALAVTTRDRQLVAVAAAYLRGDGELFDVLVRDHLADHPDNLVAAWIACRGPVLKPSTKGNPSC